MSFQRNSTLRQAFMDCRVNVRYAAPVAVKVLDSLHRQVGLVRERGWNLNASKKMVEKVNKECELTLQPSF